MPTQNDSMWEGLESSFFGTNDNTPSETPDVNSYVPETGSNRMILNMIFLIDVSGSMRGNRIAQVNYALENIVKEMRTREDLNSVLKIAIMEFADQSEWRTPRPIPLEDYVFADIKAQEWVTFYGQAFDALEKKLHKSAFMDPAQGEYYAPLILFVTDGEPVDTDVYPAALERLKRNRWFAKSSKYAILVGDKNPEVARQLARFTGLEENVRYADEGQALCDMIEYISVTASEVQTSIIADGATGGENSIFSSKDSSLFSSMFNG